jgi:hypothetical protein
MYQKSASPLGSHPKTNHLVITIKGMSILADVYLFFQLHVLLKEAKQIVTWLNILLEHSIKTLTASCSLHELEETVLEVHWNKQLSYIIDVKEIWIVY